MHCMNCGSDNDDQAKYCIKCGSKLNDAIENGSNSQPARKKSRNMFMISISLVLVVTLIIISVFDLWPWGQQDRDNNTQQILGSELKNDMQNDAQSSSRDDVVTFETFSFDAIVDECPDCQAAIETYIEMLRIGQDWTSSKEDLEALEKLKCNQMQHFCTAKTVYVENIPYVFRGGYGLYTGDWVGAGPSGKGSYFGAVYGKTVSYEGDWGYGMPNGEGRLYAESGYLKLWDTTFTGHFKNGMRDGKGSWFEYYDDRQNVVSPQPHYRIYDTAVYSNDMLTDWVDCVDYDAKTGEILGYCKMMTDEAGEPIMGATWEPDELSPEMKNALGVAGSLFIIGVTVYVTGEMIQAATDPAAVEEIYDMGLWERGPTPEWTQQEIANKKKRNDEERQQKQQEWDNNMKRALSVVDDYEPGSQEYNDLMSVIHAGGKIENPFYSIQ